nr:hypothetical protein [Tanacetum cinerariifolium]
MCMGIVLSVHGYCIECAGYLYCLHPFIIPLPSLQSAVTIIQGMPIIIQGMSIIIQGISSSGINGCISHTSSISETDHNMSTNAKLPICDIKTDHVIPNEAADASSEVEISSDMNVTKNVVKRKQDNPDKGSKSNSELFLDQLGLNMTGTIIMMLGRMWDVSAVTHRYLSTDFVVSDAKGNMIHCSAKATMSYNFLRLKEGGIYSVKKINDFDGIESSDNKYLIDVAGYVTNVGRTNHLKSGLRNLDFHLANHMLLFFADISLIPYGHKVYLSRTSSTVIYNDDAIPMIKALKKANSLSPSTVRSPLMESGQGGDRTSLYVGATPAVVVMFNETATALVNCSADSLVDTVDKSSEDHLNLPPALSNLIGTAHVMEIKSHTYYEYGTFKSFTCWQILPSEGIDDSVDPAT